MATISTPHTSPAPTLDRPGERARAGHEGAGPSRRPGVLSPGGIAMLTLLVGAFVALFFRWFVKQNQFSLDKPEDWGHVYLIPVVSAGLIWLKRDRILATTPRVFWPGLAPLLLGIMSYFFCVVGIKNHMLQGFAMILTIFGMVLLMLGPAMMRWLFLPIAYLGFGVTISEMIMNYLTFPLKLLASKGAGAVLTFLGTVFGFGVDVEGNNITVTGSDMVPHPMNVADACSGMRMVIAFIALGAAVALIRCRFWWQRVALVALSIPVAAILNIARVSVLGIASLFDSKLASGDAHMLIGTILLVPGFGLFLGVVWVLEHLVRDESQPSAKELAKKKTQASAKARTPWPEWFARPVQWTALRRPSFLVPVVLLVTAAAGFGAGIRMAGIYLQKLPINAPDNRAVRSIPSVTRSWEQEGQDRKEKPEIEVELGTENYVSRTFKERHPKDPRNPVRLDLHIAYYTGMIDTVPHVPERCFIGGGMDMVQASTVVPVPLDGSAWIPDPDAPPAEKGRIFLSPVYNKYGAVVRKVRLPRDPAKIEMNISRYRPPGAREGQEITAGYFFIANGGTVPRAEQVRLLAFNLEDDYAYYMKVQFSSSQAASAEDLARQAGTLLDELLPELMQCVPDWVEVERGDYPDNNPRRRTAGGTKAAAGGGGA